MVSIRARNWRIRQETQEMSPNGVAVQTRLTLDTSGICWQILIRVSFISFPLHGNDQ